MKTIIIAVLMVLLLPHAAGAARSSEYSPPGLYDAVVRKLDNGLRVVLKPRNGTRTVAVRLVVGVGQLDFACGLQETPHFLEHLMFAGTSRHSEAELDSLVEDHGGYWNAETGKEATTYTLDIYSKYATRGLDVLHEIMTDSLLTPESVETVRGIVQREMGGKPSRLRQWLRRHGIGKNATVKAVEHLIPGGNFMCPGLESAENVDRNALLTAYRNYYVPNNMQLIVVGDFRVDAMLAAVRTRFGALPSRPVQRTVQTPPSAPRQGAEVGGTFSPILNTEGHAALAFRVPGYQHADFFVINVLRSYLEKRLYDDIRVRRGLAYAPGVQYYNLAHFGLLFLYADTDLHQMDTTLSAIRELIVDLQGKPLDRAEVERTKRRLLLQLVQGYESNRGVADFYAGAWDEFAARGALINREAAIEAVTTGDLTRVARRYLAVDGAVVIRERPTLTYTQFYVVLGVLAVLLGGVAWWLTHRGLHHTRRLLG